MDGMIRNSVCFFCHDGKGNYVMQKRSKGARDEHDRWDAGGGGLKFGENVEDAVRREVLEEYGAHAIAIEALGYRDVHRVQDGKPTHWVALDFRVQVDPREVKIGEPQKCDAIRWLTVDEIANLQDPTHSAFPGFFAQYRTRWI